MPELPEVETVRRALAPWLTGRRIRRARRVDAPAGPKYASLERASGQVITAVQRRGKFILLALNEGDELIIHLGMTGVVCDKNPKEHVRAALELTGKRRPRLYFQDPRRFGRFLVVRAGHYDPLPTLRAMGPEPLGSAFDTTQFFEALQRCRSPIKSHLLSQRPVAGLGNIYADEALFRARIHPANRACEVSLLKVRRLKEAIVEVLAASIEANGTTFSDYRTVDGEEGQFISQLGVYGRTGSPCPRCQRAIRRVVIGQRSTHYCSNCQRRTRQAPPSPQR